MTDDATDALIDAFVSGMDELEVMYEELAGALGCAQPVMYRREHPAILARARACKAAYDQVKEGSV
ncbi:MAG: hypothetical protein WBB98_04815 [Xanthobacteraceae bacterium]